MFTYFFSLAIIAFEVICCKIFFESFCDSSGENRKYKRTILLVLLIAIYYICGFTLSKWIVLKQLCAIMSIGIFGYYVDTVGKNAKKIQEYIQNQLKEDLEYDQMTLKEYIDPFTGEPVKQSK